MEEAKDDYTLVVEMRPDINLTIWRMSGNTPSNKLMETLNRYVEDGHYKKGMNVLTISFDDTSSYSREELTALMNATVENYGPFGVDIKCASVFMQKHQFAVSRIFEAISDGTVMKFHPFEDIEEAKEWLGVDKDVVITYREPDTDYVV